MTISWISSREQAKRQYRQRRTEDHRDGRDEKEPASAFAGRACEDRTRDQNG